MVKPFFFMNRLLERSRKEEKDPDSPAQWEKHQADLKQSLYKTIIDVNHI
jgi:hypothetical protein